MMIGSRQIFGPRIVWNFESRRAATRRGVLVVGPEDSAHEHQPKNRKQPDQCNLHPLLSLVVERTAPDGIGDDCVRSAEDRNQHAIKKERVHDSQLPKQGSFAISLPETRPSRSSAPGRKRRPQSETSYCPFRLASFASTSRLPRPRSAAIAASAAGFGFVLPASQAYID